MARRNERVCVRLTRDIDGSVMMADRLPAWRWPRRSRAHVLSAMILALVQARLPTSAHAQSAPGPSATQPRYVPCGQSWPLATDQASGAFGTIVGVILDEFGAGLPAVVHVVNESTGVEYRLSADEDGRFHVHVPPGAYTIAGTCVGFSSAGRPHLHVPPQGEVHFNATLRFATIGDGVTIPSPGGPDGRTAPVVEVDAVPFGPRPSPLTLPSQPSRWTAPFRALKRLLGL